MAIRRAGGQFTVEFQQAGVRVFRRLPSAATKAQAQELETKLRREIVDQRTLGHTPDLTCERAIDLWLHDTLSRKKDQRMPRQNAEHLRPFTTGRSVREAADVARAAIQAWTRSVNGTADASRRTNADTTCRGTSRTTLGAATCNRRLAVLKAALHYAHKQGWADAHGSRIEMLREPPHREVYLTATQVKTLAASMPTLTGRYAVLLLAYTGLRAGELARITNEDIGTDSTITVRISKSGKARAIPVPKPAQSLLRHLPLGLSYQQLQWQFRAARKAAGMPHVHIHDLRHTYASMLINAGVDLFTVGRLLGHSTPSTTARYAHLAQDTLRKAVGRLR